MPQRSARTAYAQCSAYRCASVRLPSALLTCSMTGRTYWQEDECQALGRYRDVVESTLSAAVAAENAGELAAQLQYALDYRVIIERGVGYLMARDGLDSMTAFNRLRRAARDTQSKIGDVAQRLVSTGRLPTERLLIPDAQTNEPRSVWLGELP